MTRLLPSGRSDTGTPLTDPATPPGTMVAMLLTITAAPGPWEMGTGAAPIMTLAAGTGVFNPSAPITRVTAMSPNAVASPNAGGPVDTSFLCVADPVTTGTMAALLLCVAGPVDADLATKHG